MIAGRVRVCACGRRYDSSRWELLPRVVKNRGIMDDGDGGYLELRNCPCGSTLAEEITLDDVKRIQNAASNKTGEGT